MQTTNKQRIAMVAIVAAGTMLALAALLLDHRSPSHAGAEVHPPRATATEGEEHADVSLVMLSAEQIDAAGIERAIAGPALLEIATRFPGEIRFNEDRTAHVVPRVGGVVERVGASLGQLVRTGEVLATISSTMLSEQRSELLTATRRLELARTAYQREKTLWEEKISAQQDYLQAESVLQEARIAVQNASQKLAALGATRNSRALNRFEIRAPFDGTVVEKHITLGEAVKDDASIFTLADLSTVWAEFAVSARDLATVRVGQKVMVSSTAFESRVEGTVSYVGSLLGEQTRTAKARVTLANPNGAWRPGLFVTVAVWADEQEAALVVNADAIQTIDGRPTVFVIHPEGFVVRPIRPGRSDGTRTEVLEGLRAGESYASSNAFVLKADLGKAGAEHGH